MVLGAFLKTAELERGENCQVIDYSDLNQVTIEKIAKLFSIEVTPNCAEAIRDSFSIYSKDSRRARIFVDDRDVKRACVTKMLQNEITGWAETGYQRLMAVPQMI